MSEDQAKATEESGQGLLDREGDAAADYLEGLLDIADLDGDIDIGVEGSRAMVSVIEVNAGELAELVRIAQDAIAEAQRTAAPVRLEPMTPFERKVVHDVVAEAGLTSESEGDEPARRVVIRTA